MGADAPFFENGVVDCYDGFSCLHKNILNQKSIIVIYK